ncbi:MAG: SpoIIE family protein phosphatase [Campylobacterota bacterium]|nr:SpoIIE family protein phosphatase [Campylobacterota bacterium]
MDIKVKKKKFRSISKKLFLVISISTVAVLGPSLMLIFFTMFAERKADITHGLELSTKIMSKNLAVSVDFGLIEDAQNILKTLSFNKNIDAALIYSDRETLFTSYTTDNMTETSAQSLIDKFLTKENFLEDITDNETQHIIACRAIYMEENEDTLGTFCIISNKKELEAAYFKIFSLIVIIFILSLSAVFIVAKKIEHMFILPIFQMKDAMQKVTLNNDYDIDIQAKENDEFKILFDGFTSMLSTIKGLIIKVQDEQKFTQTLLDSQEQIIITTDGTKTTDVNSSFLTFFDIDSQEEFQHNCICETFDPQAGDEYLQMKIADLNWVDYIIQNPKLTHKVQIYNKSQRYIFSVTASELPVANRLKAAVFTDITLLEKAKEEGEEINKLTRESIEYASLIQGALIPDNKTFTNHFKDYFAIWHPKDTVGGDIYLFEELRDKDECLLMVIDCTGHGVPGAFVTMLVKAIERQIVAKINHSDVIVSPADILTIFNQNMKSLLKQENKYSLSNAGFDGGVLYYNKKEKIVKFAGAETPLFYVENGELNVIKGNRYSVGYKKCDMDYIYKEHTIEIKDGMQFYLTTDGYLDQNGGNKGFPFGKKRFKNMIEEYHIETMADQQEVFLNELLEYQDDYDTNDDITVIGFSV